MSKTPKVPSPRNVAPGPSQETAVTSSGSGVRSLPVFASWDSRKSDPIFKSRSRVQTSRAIQEALPFVRYMTTAIPEEAISGGLNVKSASKNPAFRKAANDIFWRWADSDAIDIRRRFDFYSAQTMLGSTTLGDGEVFIQKVKDDRPEAQAWSDSDRSRRRLQVQFFTRDQLGDGPAETHQIGRASCRERVSSPV